MNAEDHKIDVVKLQSGDNQEWTLLREKFHRPMMVQARSMVRNKCDAEEIVQGVWGWLWEVIGHVKPSQSIRNVLATACYRRCIDWTRGHYRKTKVLPVSSLSSRDDNGNMLDRIAVDDKATDLEETKISEDMAMVRGVASRRIAELRAGGSVNRARVVESVFLKCQSVADAARNLGIDAKVVSNHKHAEMQILRRELCSPPIVNRATVVDLGPSDHPALTSTRKSPLAGRVRTVARSDSAQVVET